jgi:hypothetical protein
MKEREDKAIGIIVRLSNLITRWDSFLKKLDLMRPSLEDPNVVCLGAFLDSVRQYSNGFRFS